VYYVSPSGSDSNSGSSPCFPWQSISKVESFGARPGDTIAFQGGSTFTSPLSFWSGLHGSASQAIYFTSYGTGPSDLAGGVYVKSASYLTLVNLTITSAAGPGVGTASSGTGATNIVVSGSNISSTYTGGIGSYGIGLRNALDSRWTITDDTISNTADSGVFSLGSLVTIDHDTLANNGIGPHCGTASGQNPCHGVYSMGPGTSVLDNTISNPQTAGISLRYQNDIVQGNNVSGGQKGIAFSSETTTPGTTYILGNTVYGQGDTAIQAYSGTKPLYESFVIASNTIYNPTNYAIYAVSGPSSGSTQTVTLANNLIDAGTGTRGYINLAKPVSYTASTYTDHYDLFYGAGNPTPYHISGIGLTWTAYANAFGTAAEGFRDRTLSNPLLNTSTLTLHSGSPAIGAGTTAIPGITYTHITNCPISDSGVPRQWSYCNSPVTPDIGTQ
jgi:hypothetical protein